MMTPDEMLAATLLSQIRIAAMPEDLRLATGDALKLLEGLIQPPVDPSTVTWREKLGVALLMRVCAVLTMDPILNRASGEFAKACLDAHGVPYEPPEDMTTMTPLMWLSTFIEDADKYPLDRTSEGSTVH